MPDPSHPVRIGVLSNSGTPIWTAGPAAMVKPNGILSALAAIPGLVYVAISAVIVAAMACRVGTIYSFNVNEGWNAFWASAAWNGANLYPPVGDLKLNNYPPLWFYLTGALGHLVGDDIRAGRAIAGAALLLNGAVISLIAREIIGAGKSCWLAGAAFVAIFGLFYPEYAAADDPQVAASLLMNIALLLVVRRIGEASSSVFYAGVVLLMLVAGLIKHNIFGVPLSLALFFLLYRKPRALISLIGMSVVGGAVACAGLYLAYGKGVFTSLLLPRAYHIDVAWEQTGTEMARYGLLLAVIPFLATRSDLKSRLILIYATVSLVQGAVLAGGYDVDVNVFFDLLFCISVGLGVMADAALQFIRSEGRSWASRWAAVACWISIALLPPLLEMPSARQQLGDAFAAVRDTSYEAELRYIRSSPAGRVVCEDLAYCYWAGRPLSLDLNTLRIVVWSNPEVENEVVKRIERCDYALILLKDDWTDRVDGPLTDRIRDTLVSRYEQVRATAFGLYWRPRCGSGG
jgi:hypothetical protein